MVEFSEHKSGQTEGGLLDGERVEWDRLLFYASLLDAHRLDDFSHLSDSLQFSWLGSSHGSLALARLDRFYVGQWGQARGDRVGIIPSHVLSDHALVRDLAHL